MIYFVNDVENSDMGAKDKYLKTDDSIPNHEE